MKKIYQAPTMMLVEFAAEAPILSPTTGVTNVFEEEPELTDDDFE